MEQIMKVINTVKGLILGLMSVKELFIFCGLLISLIGGIILGFVIIKRFKNIYFESLNTMHTCFSENSDLFISIKKKMESYLKNPKVFKWYKDLFDNKPTKENFKQDN